MSFGESASCSLVSTLAPVIPTLGVGCGSVERAHAVFQGRMSAATLVEQALRKLRRVRGNSIGRLQIRLGKFLPRIATRPVERDAYDTSGADQTNFYRADTCRSELMNATSAAISGVLSSRFGITFCAPGVRAIDGSARYLVR